MLLHSKIENNGVFIRCFFIVIICMLLIPLSSYADAKNSVKSGIIDLSVQKKQLKTIIVDNYYPYTFVNQNGDPDGFSVDLIRAVTQEMGLELEIHVGAWDLARNSLKNGRIDILPMMAYSGERDRYFDFSAPHTIAYDAFFTRKDASKIWSLDDFRGKKIIVMKGDQAHDYLLSTEYIGPEQLILVKGIPNALKLLSSGKGDAALMPKLVGLVVAKNLKLSNIQLSPIVVEAYNRPFSFAVVEGNLPILERLSQGLGIIKESGQYGNIYKKWFGALESPGFPLRTILKYIGGIIFVFALIGSVLLLWSFSLRKQVALRTKNLGEEIAERNQVEEALRESEERLNAILMATPSPMVLYDYQGKPEYLNKAFTDVFGWALDELKGQRIPFVPEDQKQITSEKIKELFSLGKTIRFETKRLTKYGNIINVIVSTAIIKNIKGKIINLVVNLTDLSEQQQLKKKIQEESDNFNNVYYNAFSAISTIDGDKFIDCNRTFVTMLNAGDKIEVLNTHPSQLSPEKQLDGRLSLEKANEMIAIAYEKGFNNFEWTHKKITGEKFPVDVSLTKINYRGKPVLHCLWKDLSKEKIMINNLNIAKNNAEAAAKSKSEFLANMSHEIRTPMNGVVGMIDMLLDTNLAAEQYEFAEAVQTSADTLLTLINDILDFSKIEAGKLDMENIDFDLRTTLESLSDVMAIKANEKGIALACLIPDSVPCLLKGDPGRLRQILINLTGNAIKFVKEGEVYIRVSLKKETETTAKLLFEVKDTGIGIPQDKLDLLFESFTQADASMTRKYGGTGLGLTISKQLSELMGGQIGVESEEGRGSTFWFTVVLKKQTESRIKDIVIPEGIKGKNILVVDDYAINRKVFGVYLESWNCRFSEAENGNQALIKLREAVESRDPYHIAIVDMQMPEMTGESLGLKIKDDPELRNMHLIMATSVGERGDATRLEKIGFAAFLTKPIKKATLFDCIRIVLGLDDNLSKNSVKHIVTSFTVKERKAGVNKTDRQLQILLAEDNIMNQKVAKIMLKKMGHSVIIANNGREAVDIFEDKKFDIILMDGQMPVMDGLEAAKAIRDVEKKSKTDRIPIVAVTANAMKGDRELFLAAGMDDYITKPLKRKILEEVMKRVIG